MTTVRLQSVLTYLKGLNLSSSNKRWLAEHYFQPATANDAPIVSAQEISKALTVDEVEERLLNMVHSHYHKTSV